MASSRPRSARTRCSPPPATSPPTTATAPPSTNACLVPSPSPSSRDPAGFGESCSQCPGRPDPAPPVLITTDPLLLTHPQPGVVASQTSGGLLLPREGGADAAVVRRSGAWVCRSADQPDRAVAHLDRKRLER